MRVLTAIGLAEEVGTETYAANANTHFKIRQGSIGAEKHQYVGPRPLLRNVTLADGADNLAVLISILAWYSTQTYHWI